MAKEANKTLNPDHPDHPAQRAKRGLPPIEDNSTQDDQATMESTTADASPAEGTTKQKYDKEALFQDCFGFVADFANAGNLTGRALLVYIERSNEIMNKYKTAKAEEAQTKKGKKK